MNDAYHHPAANLPDALTGLVELALDLRWSWSHESDALWKRIDPDTWAATRNPYVVLRGIGPARAADLIADRAFMAQLDRLDRSRRDYLDGEGWIGAKFRHAKAASVAYFSMEFGLGKALPLYAGGLGVLAGDYLKTASDLGAPVIGIGLLYQQGYFRQLIDRDGRQQVVLNYNDPATLPVLPARRPSGGWLTVRMQLPGREIRLRVWEARVGRVQLYLLDSNDPVNSAVDRGITGQLYGGGREMRLVQEIVLGVGGWGVLEALHADVDVCHLNEGHAAFATLERLRVHMRRHGVDFWDALWATRAGNVFTTHTSVAAAFDAYPPALLAQYGTGYAAMLGLPPAALLRLGQTPGGAPDEPFRMAMLAGRTCARVNGVSELHGQVSRQIFSGLYPRWPVDEVPIGHVTNGVHMPTWDSPWSDRIWTDAAGKERWRDAPVDIASAIADLPDSVLWQLRAGERADLVEFVRSTRARQHAQHGADPATVAAAASVLDPDALTIGFARRFTPYKRNDLLLADEQRLARLLTDPDRPVQLVIAGKAHPADADGRAMIERWHRFACRPGLGDRIAFLEDYDMTLAQEMVQGVDVWLNTPRPPWEACGTSGMKVLVNGGLNVSSLDGWWAEAYEPAVGWALGDAVAADDAERDRIDAEAAYTLLETDIVPAFYRRDADGVPRDWVARIRASMSGLVPRFSSNRMLRDYVDSLYLPAAAGFRERMVDGGRIAAELRDWSERLRARWHSLRILDAKVESEGGVVTCELRVDLGGIEPDAVQAELYADGFGGPPIRAALRRVRSAATDAAGHRYRGQVRSDRPPAHFTPRIVPCHPHAHVPAELRLIHWYADKN